MKAIDKEDLVEFIKNEYEVTWEDGYLGGMKDACVDILNKIESMPVKETGWISVLDEMPQARRSVILSTKDWTGEGCYWETTEHHVIWKGYRWNATYWDDEVVAWKPLPNPIKER